MVWYLMKRNPFETLIDAAIFFLSFSQFFCCSIGNSAVRVNYMHCFLMPMGGYLFFWFEEPSRAEAILLHAPQLIGFWISSISYS